MVPVFGSEGIYAERSSICKAAVHAGLIRTGGIFTVAIESPNLSFAGSVQNGVESKSLHLSAGEVVRSMRLFKIREVCHPALPDYLAAAEPTGLQECPGDILGYAAATIQAPLTSFIEAGSRSLAMSSTSAPTYDPALEAATEAAKNRISRTYADFS